MKRYYILFKGRVQGVGFRYTVYQIAYKYNLSGSVKNLDNGDVEAYVEGNKNNLNEFVYEVTHLNSHFIRIDDYVIKEVKPIDSTSFEILY